MWSNMRYVLLTATRDRLFLGLMVAVLAAAYISSVLGSTALLEPAQMTLSFTAASARVIVMIGLIVFIGFHMRTAFDAREIDLLLSRPISRTSLVLSYWLGFAAVAVVLVVPTVALVYSLHVLSVTGYALWAVSFLLEALLVVSFALFASLTVRSGVASVLASLAMYTIARMMGFFMVTVNNTHGIFKNAALDQGTEWVMQGVSMLVPRLDFFAKSEWLIYGPKSYDDVTLCVTQALVFVPLLLVVSIIDFKRKEF